MLLTGYILSGLIAASIILIGTRFLLAPATAANGYGVEVLISSSGVTPWLAVKGLRDIVSGLFLALLMAKGSPRLVGEFLIIASLIAWGDAVIVLVPVDAARQRLASMAQRPC